MNKKIFLISTVLVIASLLSCDKEKDPDHMRPFVTRVDMDEMAAVHLPGFYLKDRDLRDYLGREYFYMRESDTTGLRITVGLFKSAVIAENVAMQYLNSVSVMFWEGTQVELSVGDKCWYSGEDLEHTRCIAFIRKNAFFIIGNYYNYTDVRALAEKVDDGIMKNAGYVDLENTISLPVIFSITATKTILNEGEMSKITVHASDPNNESMEYQGIGIGHYDPDPENMFTVIAHPDNIGEPFFGPHKYNF